MGFDFLRVLIIVWQARACPSATKKTLSRVPLNCSVGQTSRAEEWATELRKAKHDSTEMLNFRWECERFRLMRGANSLASKGLPERNKKDTLTSAFKLLQARLELAPRVNPDWILSPTRLPIPPLERGIFSFQAHSGIGRPVYLPSRKRYLIVCFSDYCFTLRSRSLYFVFTKLSFALLRATSS